MSVAQKHRETLISSSFGAVAVGLVVPGFEKLPDTLLSTLGKDLAQAIAVDGYLVLRVASLQCRLAGGTLLTGSEFLNFLKISRSASMELVLLEKV